MPTVKKLSSRKQEGVVSYYSSLQAYPWPQPVRYDLSDMNMLGDVPELRGLRDDIAKRRLAGRADEAILRELSRKYPQFENILVNILSPSLLREKALRAKTEAGTPADLDHGLKVSLAIDKATLAQTGTHRPAGMQVLSNYQRPFTRVDVGREDVRFVLQDIMAVPGDRAAAFAAWAFNNPGKIVSVAGEDGPYVFVYDFGTKLWRDNIGEMEDADIPFKPEYEEAVDQPSAKYLFPTEQDARMFAGEVRSQGFTAGSSTPYGKFSRPTGFVVQIFGVKDAAGADALAKKYRGKGITETRDAYQNVTPPPATTRNVISSPDARKQTKIVSRKGGR